MIRGGYQIIDLEGVALTVDQVTIPGLYEVLEGNNGKPILISGVNIGGKKLPDIFAAQTTESGVTLGRYEFPIYGGTLEISQRDAVRFTTNS